MAPRCPQDTICAPRGASAMAPLPTLTLVLHREGYPPFSKVAIPPLLVHFALHAQDPDPTISKNQVPPGRSFRLLQPQTSHFPLYLPQLLGGGAQACGHSSLLAQLCLHIPLYHQTLRAAPKGRTKAFCPCLPRPPHTHTHPRLLERTLPSRDEAQSNALSTEMRTEAPRREMTCQRAHANLAPGHRYYHLRAGPWEPRFHDGIRIIWRNSTRPKPNHRGQALP